MKKARQEPTASRAGFYRRVSPLILCQEFPLKFICQQFEEVISVFIILFFNFCQKRRVIDELFRIEHCERGIGEINNQFPHFRHVSCTRTGIVNSIRSCG
jgi:hypothetical protein